MYKKMRTGMLITVAALALVLTGLVFGLIRFRETHVFLAGRSYPRDALELDLRDQSLTPAQHDQLQQLLPQTRLVWNVPFQGRQVDSRETGLTITTLSDPDLEMLRYLPGLIRVDATGCEDYARLAALQERYPQLEVTYQVTIDGIQYPNDAAAITLSSLTAEEVELLDHLPQLRTVDARECKDYAELAALLVRRPEVQAEYTVEILGQEYPSDVQELELENVSVQQLNLELQLVPRLKSVFLREPAGTAQELVFMTQDHPQIAFTWEKTVLGKTFLSSETEYDFSGMAITTGDVEKAMAYFPNAQKVIMSDCGIDNETMAAFREKMRPSYKVVWTVIVTRQRVRTDDTIFHSSGRHVCLIEEQSQDLIYCEDMIIVDVGHSYLKSCDWVRGMPNLRYLILADNWLRDISALSSCKNLVYLELFINKHLKDLTPLLGCTALEDLSVSDVYADLTPLAQMPWLKNLWANNVNASAEERAALEAGLPNTVLCIDQGTTTGGGWRQLQHYYDMRDMMGLPYNAW